MGVSLMAQRADWERGKVVFGTSHQVLNTRGGCDFDPARVLREQGSVWKWSGNMKRLWIVISPG
jgi:hypothetical protein